MVAHTGFLVVTHTHARRHTAGAFDTPGERLRKARVVPGTTSRIGRWKRSTSDEFREEVRKVRRDVVAQADTWASGGRQRRQAMSESKPVRPSNDA